MGGSPLNPGSAVDRYTIEALIGRGGMGEVYRANDTKLRRKVALKVLRMDEAKNPDGVARLLREARAAAALNHPNTVAIHDLGESEGLFYIVMELVSGQPLLAFVGDERVSLARRLKWLTEIARALEAAHKAGVIHRDVKPSNVMVNEDDIAKVLDFGLAKPMPKTGGEPESFGFKTAAGRVLGTVRYMAPEQMIGSDADGRSDQYSLGMTAFELIAGKYPPGKPFEVPPLLNTLVSGFPADGALAVARMLKRIPEERFHTMEDVANAFEDIASNRPVRALGAQAGPKPARRAVTIEDKTVLDPPNKHSPETLPEKNAVGSTLASAEATLFHGSEAKIVKAGPATDDDASADTVASDVLQNTVAPAVVQQMAYAATVLPNDPNRIPTVPPTEAAPTSNPAASTTLQSADAGDRVKAVREATAKEMAKEVAKDIAATLASTGERSLVDELRKASVEQAKAKPEKEPKPKSGSAGSTLASPGASDAVKAVRAATKTPARVESVPPPKKGSTPEKETDDSVETTAKTPKIEKKSNLVWIVLTIAFLALAAFAGNYFGARSRAKE